MRYLLIKSKKDNTPLLSVEEGKQYRLPPGYKIGDVTIEVWQEAPPAVQPVPSQVCSSCGGAAVLHNCCCSERAAGYRSKWVCPVCHFVGYVR